MKYKPDKKHTVPKHKTTEREAPVSEGKGAEMIPAEPVCPHRKSCGGCQTWNLTYAEECSMKMSRLISLLGRYGHIEEILKMDDPYHYRNKMQTLFSFGGKNNIQYGIYQASGREHTDTPRIVRLKGDGCLIENETSGKIVHTIAGLLAKHRVTVWDGRHGQLRHVMIRYAKGSDTYMVVLVTSSYPFPGGKALAEDIVRKYPKVKSVVRQINTSDTPLWMDPDKEGEILFGAGTITDGLADCVFRISAQSFYQVNTTMTEVLYRIAITYAGLSGGETILDAYCGIGTIGIAAAKNTPGIRRVIGFDSSRSSIRDAEINARINAVAEKCTYRTAKDDKFAAQLLKEEDTIDVAFVDPPRAGLAEDFRRALCAVAPKKIVYVSCNPETLARDLGKLRREGYKAERIQPVDMFPHTTHVETVCLLSKLRSKEHIEIEVKMDELDLTSAESKATYDEIKAYVLEKHGLKVSSLYISQVKRKCGLDVGQNYSLSKKEDAKVPQCPPEKEAAIMDALKHFK